MKHREHKEEYSKEIIYGPKSLKYTIWLLKENVSQPLLRRINLSNFTSQNEAEEHLY